MVNIGFGVQYYWPEAEEYYWPEAEEYYWPEAEGC